MERLRFATARALFETFATAAADVGAPPTDEHPFEFMRRLAAAGKVVDAVSFCAYVLPRREAVWWTCQGVRALPGPLNAGEEQSLAAAEAWVANPEEPNRINAHKIAQRGKHVLPATWAAYAAGYAGRVFSQEEFAGVPIAPHLTPRAARTAMMLAALKLLNDGKDQYYQARLDQGLELAARR